MVGGFVRRSVVARPDRAHGFRDDRAWCYESLSGMHACGVSSAHFETDSETAGVLRRMDGVLCMRMVGTDSM
ncbi:hypothetical protein AA0522_1963 [Gluconacetobacter liquefaciens NRIC 0522]|nr:hypothetical protein AA0522_1963 [Gluconacetobacter liquefaciens NRIC 0522]